MSGADASRAIHGFATDLDAYVVGSGFLADGTTGFALGDGTVRLFDPGGKARAPTRVCEGAILALSPDSDPARFLCGDDAGGLHRIDSSGEAHLVARFPGKWVEHLAIAGAGRAALCACSAGRRVCVFDAQGATVKTFEHPSSVTGIAFDPKGKRVFASHYNGVSVWFVGSSSTTPRRLEWKGSHTLLALHPSAEAVVTAMQENALHGWWLNDGRDMQMSGYPTKTESLSFSRTGKWLATSGADSVIVWPFFAGGPMGKPPIELATRPETVCTRVAWHPRQDLCAAGFADGAVVLAGFDAPDERALAPPSGAPITALAWNHNGTGVAFGTEAGLAGVAPVPD